MTSCRVLKSVSDACADILSLYVSFPAPFTVTGGMALSPPFIMSTAMSSTGVMAAGTADGRLWLGFGGEKRSLPGSSKKKRAKKWEGLRDDDELAVKIAEGPIVAMCVIMQPK